MHISPSHAPTNLLLSPHSLLTPSARNFTCSIAPVYEENNKGRKTRKCWFCSTPTLLMTEIAQQQCTAASLQWLFRIPNMRSSGWNLYKFMLPEGCSFASGTFISNGECCRKRCMIIKCAQCICIHSRSSLPKPSHLTLRPWMEATPCARLSWRAAASSCSCCLGCDPGIANKSIRTRTCNSK